MKTHTVRAPLAALPLAVLATFSSHAQTTGLSFLPETIVTATRFNETLSSLPMGVSVITADQIRATGASTVNEAVMKLLGVPGRQDSYGGGDYALDLRGFGTTSDSNQVVVLDGVRLNEADLGGTRLAGIPIDSVERIEVLRGSGSVLYGEGATGGVIVITTKAGNGSARRNSATLYGAAGSNALRELRANATVASGGFSLDLHGQRRETDNHRDNFRSETDGAGLSAQWSNDILRLGLRHDRDALETGLPGSLTAAQYAANPRQTDPSKLNDRASIRNERSGVFAEAMLGNWQFGLDAGSRDKALTSVRPGSVYVYDVEATQVALKARHTSQWGAARNALVIGHDRGEWERVVQGAFGSVADQTARGWYLKDDLTLSSGTRLSAGVRTEKLSKNVDDGFAPVELSERETAWELGVSQPLSTATTVWGRVGNSFRLANVDEFSFTNPAVMIRPQTSRDLEAGMRWAQGAYKLEARLYRSNLTDEIGYDRNAPGPFGANINFDPTRRQGLEIDGDWKLNSALSLSARVALRRSTFREGPYSGKDVPLAPRHTLALRADWVPIARHRVSAGVNFVGSQHPDFANACRMPAYTTADARYAVQVKNMEWSFGVNNLFDRDFYTQAFGCEGGQTTSIYPEAGRTFTAALRVSF